MKIYRILVFVFAAPAIVSFWIAAVPGMPKVPFLMVAGFFGLGTLAAFALYIMTKKNEPDKKR